MSEVARKHGQDNRKRWNVVRGFAGKRPGDECPSQAVHP